MSANTVSPAASMNAPAIKRAQGFDVTTRQFFEGSAADTSHLEGWCYTDRITYAPGDQVKIFGSSTAEAMDISILRDDSKQLIIHKFAGLQVPFAATPIDAASNGCDWPLIAEWVIPQDCRSGFYLMLVKAHGAGGTTRDAEHGFFVRSSGTSRADTLLVATTSTWAAYNDWGGTNSYYTAIPVPGQPSEITFGARLSLHRPWARGFLWLPEGAPRKPHDPDQSMGAVPRYPPVEFAYARGYSKWYANAGWATYERPFALWAEANGYLIDYATQHDLHGNPNLLDNYACVVMVGHDEYWSWEMRDAIDAYINAGGNFAHFGANFAWQIRYENEGTVQVCYKDEAEVHDPIAKITPERTTTTWDSPITNRPGAATMGLTCSFGVYAGVGGQVARGTGGFTVYRHNHWAFAGTGLGYGDVFGGSARIFGYEVDGLDYEVRKGLPFPTFLDGAPETVSILAMGLTSNREDVGEMRGATSYYGDSSAFLARLRYGKVDAEALDAASRGSGMIVTFERGKGQVFNAGSSEWVSGLKQREPFTEAITRNVLDRFLLAAGDD